MRRQPRECGKGRTGVRGNQSIVLGQHWSYNIYDDPKRLAFVLSRYQFAAEIVGYGKRVLELGCSEGLAGLVLADHAMSYVGVDSDSEAIGVACRNWERRGVSFIEGDFMGRCFGEFDAVVSMDVVEHIDPKYELVFFDTVRKNLVADGLCVIGTPNLAASAHASAVSRANHINLFDGKRLKNTLSRHFRNVFVFGMNDEVVHTGFLPMAHFLLGIGCSPYGDLALRRVPARGGG